MRYLSENALNIYTDGSSLQGPRRGGVGYRLIWTNDAGEQHTHTDETARWDGATNNEMELQALIEVLELVTGRRPPVERTAYDHIVIHTDSAYVAGNYPSAIYEWSKNGWRLKGGAPPENLDQWRKLVTLVRRAAKLRKFVEIKQIPRRSDEHARAVDNAAKRSAKSPLKAKGLRPRAVTRKLSERKVEPGSVPMVGQSETIRIIASWRVGSPHKGYRYKYEVVGGPHGQCVDLAVCEEILHRASSYRVQFNDDPGNPHIDTVLEKVALPTEAEASGYARNGASRAAETPAAGDDQ